MQLRVRATLLTLPGLGSAASADKQTYQSTLAARWTDISNASTVTPTKEVVGLVSVPGRNIVEQQPSPCLSGLDWRRIPTALTLNFRLLFLRPTIITTAFHTHHVLLHELLSLGCFIHSLITSNLTEQKKDSEPQPHRSPQGIECTMLCLQYRLHVF